MDSELNAAALEVQRLAAEAQAELMRLIALSDTLLTVQQAKAVQQQFNAAFVQLLAARLNNVPATGPRDVWDVRMVREMKVGDVSLSQRLYANASQTAQHVAALVREHAQGKMQARELAIRLYDGYNPKDGIVRPLEGAARAKLPKALKQLTANPIDRAALQQVFEQGQRYAQSLKTEPLKAAYLQALKAWEKGKGAAALERGLEIAHKEKTRYMANRIAQTELARAHQHAVADALMADDTISVVQVQMSASHPVFDVCDLHSKADLWGLGPGCYPKEKAPKPPWHPHCRCRIRSKPSLQAAMAREAPGGEAAYLRSLPVGDAIKIAGSRARLQRLLNGEKFDDVVNEGRDAMYRLERLGAMQLPAKVPVAAAASSANNPPPVVAPKTVNDYIQAGRAITATLPDGATDARACHAALLDFLQKEVGISTPCKVASSGAGAKLVKQASQLYPDSWTKAADDFGSLYTKAKANTRGHAVTTTVPPSRGKGYLLKDFGSTTFEQNAGYIMVRTGDIGNATHEYAHRLQSALPELDKLFQELHTSRVVGDQVKRIKDVGKEYAHYDPKELTREDHYTNAYQGKEYNTEMVGGKLIAHDGGAVEVMTMGFEAVLGVMPNHSKSRLYFEKMYTQDRNMFDFVVGVLRHWKP